jgi:hypothetical protein
MKQKLAYLKFNITSIESCIVAIFNEAKIESERDKMEVVGPVNDASFT